MTNKIKNESQNLYEELRSLQSKPGLCPGLGLNVTEYEIDLTRFNAFKVSEFCTNKYVSKLIINSAGIGSSLSTTRCNIGLKHDFFERNIAGNEQGCQILDR